ncbi:MAG: pseudouridylate synthase [Bacteroidales bacterium]|nr:pseudouridylate synthase [Bacteroidales bacterium]
MNYAELSVTSLVPQRPPFLLVDRVLHSSEEDTETVFEIKEDNVFQEDGFLSAAGVMENMAQSCACRMGCRSIDAGNPVKIGVVGAIKNFSLERLPRQGETLHTHVCILEEVFNLTLAGVVVLAGDQTIASCRIKIAVTDKVAED